MGLSDLLKGKEKTYHKDPLANDINAAGKQGLGYLKQGGENLSAVYNEDPSGVVNSQIAQENRMMRGAAQDAINRTRQLVAQRGMSNSSIGLGQEVNQQRQLSNQLGMNQASGIQRLRDMKIENGQGLMNTGTGLFQTKIQGNQNLQMQDIKRRQGGLAPLVGAAIGGYLGGPGGAQVGMGAGQTYQESSI
jgi:hypothetical protein